MKEKNNNDLVEIFDGTAWQAEMVKSLLANAEVEAFLKDEIMGTLNPWYTAPGGAGSVKVFVSSLDYDRAKLVVTEYEENLKRSS